MISDIIVPERDGLEPVIFRRKQRRETRVVAIGAPGNPLFRRRTRASGAARLFEKSFTFEEVAPPSTA